MDMTSMQVVYISILLASWCLSSAHCGEHPDGISSVSREQDALGNYHFSYSVANAEGEQFRKEGTDGLGRIVGSYGLKHVDGTHRVVDYVADKDGFRAEVRSNEPGVASAEPADAPVVKTFGGDPPLTVAATSNDDARAVFGKRLHSETSSKVAYASPNSEEKTPDETVRESRQHNFDDYRPLSPVAYYPGDDRDPAVPHVPLTSSGFQSSSGPRGPNILQGPALRRPSGIQRSPRVLQQTSEEDSRPLDVYFPPIDPHNARRPAYHPSSSRNRVPDSNFHTPTTSRRPFIPPYGGFDDDPLPQNRRPSVSMTTLHGGFGPSRLDFPTPPPTHPLDRFPPSGPTPHQRDLTRSRFPPSSSNFPSAIPNHPTGGILPSFSRGIPPQSMNFDPPSYDDGLGSPNFVLRAVPIPNGIQAVRVDPTSGRVYERLMYPLFLRHDGYPAYDRNILLHNDEMGDDDASRNFDNSGNFDIPFPDRPFRGARNPNFVDDENRPGRSRRYNGSYTIDESNLSRPTASDMAWILRQLSQVEGFERNGFDNRVLPDSHYRDSSNFRIDEDKPPFRSNIRTSSRLRSFPDIPEFDRSDSSGFSRNPRNSDVLTVEDSKDHPTKKTAGNVSHSKEIETEGNISSSIEKE